MSAAIAVAAPVVQNTVVDDPFALDIQFITDIPAGHPQAGCDGTSDGCDPTCPSSCISSN